MPQPTELSFWLIDHEDDSNVMVTTPLNEEALKALLVKYEIPERFWTVGYHSGGRYSYHFSPIPRARTDDIGPGASAINDCGG